MGDPDEAIADALDTELARAGVLLTPDELEDVVEAVSTLPPEAWGLLCARWRARQHVPEEQEIDGWRHSV